MLILSLKFRYYLTSYMATCWYQKESSPALARQHLFEQVIESAWTLYRCKIHLNLGTDKATRSIWSHLHSHIFLPLGSWMKFACSTSKTAEITTPSRLVVILYVLHSPISCKRAWWFKVLSHWFLFCTDARLFQPLVQTSLHDNKRKGFFCDAHADNSLFLALRRNSCWYLREKIGRTNVHEALISWTWWTQWLSFDSCTTHRDPRLWLNRDERNYIRDESLWSIILNFVCNNLWDTDV